MQVSDAPEPDPIPLPVPIEPDPAPAPIVEQPDAPPPPEILDALGALIDLDIQLPSLSVPTGHRTMINVARQNRHIT